MFDPGRSARAVPARGRAWSSAAAVSRTIALICAVVLFSGPCAADPWGDGVQSFTAGAFAGFGQDQLPWIVLGPPRGGGALEGSVDALSLGNGGIVTIAFRDNVLFDGPGDDLIVYENAFHVGSEDGPVFDELAYVELSVDRVTWVRLAFDPDTREGLAGRAPVFSRPRNGIDPLSPEAGGDRFDIEGSGLTFVRFVRLVDVDGEIADVGDLVAPGGKGGFDLDAVAAIHSGALALISGHVSSAGLAVERARVILHPAAGVRRYRRRTDADGFFSFSRVTPSGEYTVRARRVGLGKAVATVHVDMTAVEADVDLALAR
jgi:hypothetical protein